MALPDFSGSMSNSALHQTTAKVESILKSNKLPQCKMSGNETGTGMLSLENIREVA